jgi:acyl carrier protein
MNPELTAVLVKQVVELRSTHFERMRRAVSKRFTEVKGLMRGTTVTHGKIGTQLGYTDGLYTIQHAEPLENGQVHGQQRLADVKSWVAVFFQQSDVPATHFHQASKRRARRSTPYNEHIEFIRDHGAVRQSFSCQIRVTIYHSVEEFQANRNMDNIMQEQTEREHKLAELIVKSLNLEDVAPDEIQPEEPLFGDGLGLDSIDALELALAISKTYSIQLKAEDDGVQEAFATLRSLDAYIVAQGG